MDKGSFSKMHFWHAISTPILEACRALRCGLSWALRVELTEIAANLQVHLLNLFAKEAECFLIT